MITQQQVEEQGPNADMQARNENVGKWVLGIVLIAIGVLNLVGVWTSWEWAGLLIMPGLAAIFLIAGILTRQAGWFVPTGILGGLGVGVLLISGPMAAVSDLGTGGVIMLSFAAGWASITLLTALFTHDKAWWALIPAAIMGFIGAALLLGGQAMEVLELVGRYWPLALIAAGIYVLLRRGK